jgi:hypothetical protein
VDDGEAENTIRHIEQSGGRAVFTSGFHCGNCLDSIKETRSPLRSVWPDGARARIVARRYRLKKPVSQVQNTRAMSERPEIGFARPNASTGTRSRVLFLSIGRKPTTR